MKIDLLQHFTTQTILKLPLSNIINNYILFNNKELQIIYDNKQKKLFYKNIFGAGHNLLLIGLILLLCELLEIYIEQIEFKLIENADLNLYELFKMKRKNIIFSFKDKRVIKALINSFDVSKNFSHKMFYKEFFIEHSDYFLLLRKIYNKYFVFNDKVLNAVSFISKLYKFNKNTNILWWRRTDTNKYLFPDNVSKMCVLDDYLDKDTFIISDDIEIREFYKNKFTVESTLPIPQKTISRWRDGDSNLYLKNSNLEFLRKYKMTKLDYYKVLFAYILISKKCKQFIGYIGALSVFINCIRERPGIRLYSFKTNSFVVAR